MGKKKQIQIHLSIRYNLQQHAKHCVRCDVLGLSLFFLFSFPEQIGRGAPTPASSFNLGIILSVSPALGDPSQGLWSLFYVSLARNDSLHTVVVDL